MFSDVLLTVDFDRTLTGPNSEIPERNLQAIRYFMDNNGAFTLNTGRSVNTMGSLLDTLPVNAPFLLYNGSAAYENGKLINCRTLELDVWKVIEEIQTQFPEINLEIQSDGPHYLYQAKPEFIALCDTLGWKHRPAIPGADMSPVLKFALFGQVRENNVGNFFYGSAEELEHMAYIENWVKERYAGKVSVFRAAPRIVDIHAANVNKGLAARRLQRQLGRKILVCVGDAENDITMLDSADYAFVPADAVLSQQYENVCNCADGAVADVIYKKIPEILHIQP